MRHLRSCRGSYSLSAMILLGVFLAAGCSDDDPAAPEPPEPASTVVFHMAHSVGDQDLILDQIQYVNAAGDDFGVTRLQYYISKIEFRGPDGSFKTDVIHYTDAEVPGTHTFEIDGIIPRHYHDVVFTFGLEDDQNLDLIDPDVHPELKGTGHMVWSPSLGGGFHYMRLEGRYLQADSPEGAYATHMGRCPVDDEGTLRAHSFQVSLTPHLQLEDGATAHVELIMDVKKWYESPNQISLSEHSAIMANGEAQLQLQENGLGDGGTGHVWYLGDVDDGGNEE